MRKHKGRILMLVFAGLLAFLVVRTYMAQPREVVVELRFGEDRTGIQRATLHYRRQEELVRTVTFNYASGAPEAQRHTARIPEGQYLLQVELESGDDRRARVEQAFEARADSVVVLDLGAHGQ